MNVTVAAEDGTSIVKLVWLPLAPERLVLATPSVSSLEPPPGGVPPPSTLRLPLHLRQQYLYHTGYMLQETRCIF